MVPQSIQLDAESASRLHEGRHWLGLHVQDCEVLSPGTDSGLIPFGQGLCDLVQVIKVVDHPGCQQVLQGHDAQRCVLRLAIKLIGPET